MHEITHKSTEQTKKKFFSESKERITIEKHTEEKLFFSDSKTEVCTYEKHSSSKKSNVCYISSKSDTDYDEEAIPRNKSKDILDDKMFFETSGQEVKNTIAPINDDILGSKSDTDNENDLERIKISKVDEELEVKSAASSYLSKVRERIEKNKTSTADNMLESDNDENESERSKLSKFDEESEVKSPTSSYLPKVRERIEKDKTDIKISCVAEKSYFSEDKSLLILV